MALPTKEIQSTVDAVLRDVLEYATVSSGPENAWQEVLEAFGKQEKKEIIMRGFASLSPEHSLDTMAAIHWKGSFGRIPPSVKAVNDNEDQNDKTNLAQFRGRVRKQNQPVNTKVSRARIAMLTHEALAEFIDVEIRHTMTQPQADATFEEHHYAVADPHETDDVVTRLKTKASELLSNEHERNRLYEAVNEKLIELSGPRI